MLSATWFSPHKSFPCVSGKPVSLPEFPSFSAGSPGSGSCLSCWPFSYLASQKVLENSVYKTLRQLMLNTVKVYSALCWFRNQHLNMKDTFTQCTKRPSNTPSSQEGGKKVKFWADSKIRPSPLKVPTKEGETHFFFFYFFIFHLLFLETDLLDKRLVGFHRSFPSILFLSHPFPSF